MLTLWETRSFLWGQKEKRLEVRLWNQLGRGDGQVAVTAPSAMRWDHHSRHCRSERLF